MKEEYEPWKPLIEGRAERECRAVVVVPARNEEASLGATLSALAAQVDLTGAPLSWKCYEVLLLLNNCTDDSARAVARWQAENQGMRLHVAERTLDKRKACVGTARRWLMDTAWCRLGGRRSDGTGREGVGRGTAGGLVQAILSTDSDTLVAPDWVARTMAALGAGADAVGGMIELKPGELEALPAGVRRAYARDRRYQRLVAELEDLLDPQEGDARPRHLQHFGASLACTPEVYALAGGLPALRRLEDVGFVDRLRRVGARLRHDPAVKVYTSSRMKGRVTMGLSGQLKFWQEMITSGEEHTVQSAAWLAHRFRTLARLRGWWAGREWRGCPAEWRERVQERLGYGLTLPEFLGEIDCDRLVAETFRGECEGEIGCVIRGLAAAIARVRVCGCGAARGCRCGARRAVRVEKAAARPLRIKVARASVAVQGRRSSRSRR